MWLKALTLLVGESLLLGGVAAVYWPAALVLAGVQLVPIALLSGERG